MESLNDQKENQPANTVTLERFEEFLIGTEIWNSMINFYPEEFPEDLTRKVSQAFDNIPSKIKDLLQNSQFQHTSNPKPWEDKPTLHDFFSGAPEEDRKGFLDSTKKIYYLVLNNEHALNLLLPEEVSLEQLQSILGNLDPLFEKYLNGQLPQDENQKTRLS